MIIMSKKMKLLRSKMVFYKRMINELVEFIDTNIIMRSYLDHSDEFMEKLYFIRYYYNIGNKFI